MSFLRNQESSAPWYLLVCSSVGSGDPANMGFLLSGVPLLRQCPPQPAHPSVGPVMHGQGKAV